MDAVQMALMRIDPNDCKENQIKKKEKKEKTYLLAVNVDQRGC